jgi:hypothetical protein
MDLVINNQARIDNLSVFNQASAVAVTEHERNHQILPMKEDPSVPVTLDF